MTPDELFSLIAKALKDRNDPRIKDVDVWEGPGDPELYVDTSDGISYAISAEDITDAIAEGVINVNREPPKSKLLTCDELAETIGALLSEVDDPRITDVSCAGFAPEVRVHLTGGGAIVIKSADFDVELDEEDP